MAVEFPQRHADLDRLVKLEPVEIIIAEGEGPPRAKAEVDRIENRRFAAVSRTDQAVDAGEWKPVEQRNRPKVLTSILRNRAIRPNAPNTAERGLAVSAACR